MWFFFDSIKNIWIWQWSLLARFLCVCGCLGVWVCACVSSNWKEDADFADRGGPTLLLSADKCFSLQLTPVPVWVSFNLCRSPPHSWPHFTFLSFSWRTKDACECTLHLQEISFNSTKMRQLSLWSLFYLLAICKRLTSLTEYIRYSRFKNIIWKPCSPCILPSTPNLRPTLTALIVSTDQIWSCSKLGRTDDAFGKNPGDVSVRLQQTAQHGSGKILLFLHRWVWKYTGFRF